MTSVTFVNTLTGAAIGAGACRCPSSDAVAAADACCLSPFPGLLLLSAELIDVTWCLTCHLALGDTSTFLAVRAVVVADSIVWGEVGGGERRIACSTPSLHTEENVQQNSQ